MSRQTECVSKEKWRNKYVGYLSVLLEGCGLYLNRVPVWHSTSLSLSLSLSNTLVWSNQTIILFWWSMSSFLCPFAHVKPNLCLHTNKYPQKRISFQNSVCLFLVNLHGTPSAMNMQSQPKPIYSLPHPICQIGWPSLYRLNTLHAFCQKYFGALYWKVPASLLTHKELNRLHSVHYSLEEVYKRVLTLK